MIMSDNSIVNLDNLALIVMEAAVKKATLSTWDAARRLAYCRAVKTIALQIKANQALSEAQQASVLNLIYNDREHRSTMGGMRRILSEIGSTLEYKQHEILANAKL